MSKARDLANAGTALTTVSATELGYLDGVTSAVQTQINTKIAQATAINPTIVDAKGDIIAASAADTVARLAVGANDTVLTADSSTATGLKWATPAGAKNFSLLNAGGTSLTASQTITVSGISGMDELFILVDGASAGASDIILCRLNSDSGSNYGAVGEKVKVNSTYAASNFQRHGALGANTWYVAEQSNSATSRSDIVLHIKGCNTSGVKMMTQMSGTDVFGGTAQGVFKTMGYWNNSSTVSSISLIAGGSTNFDQGTIYIYGAA